MILAAESVAALQYFLLDAAKRYVVPRAGVDEAAELLSTAAALDYVLLLASEHADETLDDDSPIGAGIRETLARAARAALDFMETMLTAPTDVRADFRDRQLRAGGIFDVLRELRERGALRDDDVAFRKLTLASDLRER